MTEGLPKCVPHGLAIAHQRLGALGWTSTVLKHALLAALVNARTTLHTSANAMVGNPIAVEGSGRILSMLAVQQHAMHANAVRKEETFLEMKTVRPGSQQGIVAAVSMGPGCG